MRMSNRVAANVGGLPQFGYLPAGPCSAEAMRRRAGRFEADVRPVMLLIKGTKFSYDYKAN